LDDDRDNQLTEYAAELEAQIDEDYGYRISIMLDNTNLVNA
jgi:hypothetical protein